MARKRTASRKKIQKKSSLIALTTLPDAYAAERFAHQLVKEKLAACCNLIPQVTSIYEWEGKIEKTSEVLVVIKTTRLKFEKIQDQIKSLHPYKVPELIAVDISAGLPAYLEWIQSI